jgi:hypothetical protein
LAIETGRLPTIAAAPANSETSSNLSELFTDCHFGSSLSSAPCATFLASTSSETVGLDGAVTLPTPKPTTNATPTEAAKGPMPPNKLPKIVDFIFLN